MKYAPHTLFLAMVLCWPGLPVRAATAPSQPQRATLYRDGTAVLEEDLDPARAETAILLPAATDPATVRLLRDGRPAGGLQLEELQAEASTTDRTVVGGVVVEKTVSRKERIGYLLRPTEPAEPGQGPWTLRYQVTGLGWQPRLEANLLDRGRVAVSLIGLVRNTALDLRGCRLRLASSAGQLPSKLDFDSRRAAGNPNERAADLIYEAGLQTLAKDRTSLLTLLSAAGRYEQKLVWHTDTRERVRALVVIPNPLPQPVCPAEAHLYQAGALVSQDSVEWAPPGSRILLAAGHVHDVEVDRSVDTAENPSNRIRPFRHEIRFQVTNHGRSPVSLVAIMPKKIGSRHKTLYKFKREPDRRPGTVFIWELDLKPGQTQKVEFHLDSEFARFGEYETYETARFEMF